MGKTNHDLPLGHHVTLFHGGFFPRIKFLILDPGIRGGDWNKTLLQKEQRWIFKLNVTNFPGLSESVSYEPFLDGLVSGGPENEL